MNSFQFVSGLLVFALRLFRKVSACTPSTIGIDFLDLPKLTEILFDEEEWVQKNPPKRKPTLRDVDFFLRNKEDPNKPNERFKRQVNEICGKLLKKLEAKENVEYERSDSLFQSYVTWDIPVYEYVKKKIPRTMEFCSFSKERNGKIKIIKLGFMKAKDMPRYSVTRFSQDGLWKHYIIGTLHYVESTEIVYLSLEDLATFGLEGWSSTLAPERKPTEKEVYTLLQYSEGREKSNSAPTKEVRKICEKVAEVAAINMKNEVSLETKIEDLPKLRTISWTGISFAELIGKVKKTMELCVFHQNGVSVKMTLGFIKDKEQPNLYYVSRRVLNNRDAKTASSQNFFFGIYKDGRMELIGSSSRINDRKKIDSSNVVGSRTQNSTIIKAGKKAKEYPVSGSTLRESAVYSSPSTKTIASRSVSPVSEKNRKVSPVSEKSPKVSLVSEESPKISAILEKSRKVALVSEKGPKVSPVLEKSSKVPPVPEKNPKVALVSEKYSKCPPPSQKNPLTKGASNVPQSSYSEDVQHYQRAFVPRKSRFYVPFEELAKASEKGHDSGGSTEKNSSLSHRRC